MSSPSLSLLPAALACGFLAGCADYANRTDAISPWAGQAMEANMAVHHIRTYPPYGEEVRILSDGKVVESAQRRYRAGGGALLVPVAAASAPQG